MRSRRKVRARVRVVGVREGADGLPRAPLSPGRLHEKCLELLSGEPAQPVTASLKPAELDAGADIQFTRSHRLDVALVRNHNMALCAVAIEVQWERK